METMPKVQQFKVIIEQGEDGVFVASVPAIPGCHTQGETYEEALVNVKEAIELCVDEAREDLAYRDRITWPEEKQSSFVGVATVPVRTPSFA